MLKLLDIVSFQTCKNTLLKNLLIFDTDTHFKYITITNSNT